MAPSHCERLVGPKPASWAFGNLAAWMLWGLACSAAQAQTAPETAPAEQRFGMTRLTPSLDARVVYTNNPGPDDRTGQVHRDTVIEVQPSVVFERHGPRITLTGNAAVSAIEYLDKSHAGRLLPRAGVNLNAKVVDGLAYLDAYARVDPTFEDPFVTRPGDSTSYKLEPRTRYALSPYVSKRFDQDVSLLMRSDYTSTRVTDVSSLTHVKVKSESLDHRVSYEQQPRPLGFAVEGRTHEQRDDRVQEVVLKDRSGRLWLDYAFSPALSFGVVGGKESATSATSAVSDRIVGGRMRMRPTDRTDLRVSVEKRYFGRGWDASLEHRSPFVSIALQTGRTVSSQDVPQFVFAAGDDIRGTIERTLAGSVPDPVARRDMAERIAASQGAPAVAATDLTFYSTVPQVRQSASLSVGLRGVRNLILVQYGYLKAEAAASLALPAASNDVLQQSAALVWNARVTPLASLNAIIETSRVENLSGADKGLYVGQRTVRGEAVFSLSPRASITAGARVRTTQATKNLTANDLLGEKAVYVGLRQRF